MHIIVVQFFSQALASDVRYMQLCQIGSHFNLQMERMCCGEYRTSLKWYQRLMYDMEQVKVSISCQWSVNISNLTSPHLTSPHLK